MLHRVCREDDLTAVVSLHQVDLARMFGDRIVGLADGKVVFDGSADQITERVYGQIYQQGVDTMNHPTELAN